MTWGRFFAVLQAVLAAVGAVALVISVLRLSEGAPGLQLAIAAAGAVAQAGWAGLQGLVLWLADYLVAHPWPSLAFVALCLVALLPALRAGIARTIRNLGVKSLKASAFEIAFDPETKRKIDLEIDEAVASIAVFRRKGQAEIQRNVRSLGIDHIFRGALANVFEASFASAHATDIGARATLHVPDFIFRTRLMQLVDYYPVPGGPPGRTISHRFGIVGRVWRSGVTASAGGLTHRVAPANSTAADEVRAIQREWGLTEAEALEFRKRPSYCCVPVTMPRGVGQSGHRLLGALYIDATEPNFGWGADPGLVKHNLGELQAACDTELAKSGLPEALDKLEELARPAAPRVDLDA